MITYGKSFQYPTVSRLLCYVGVVFGIVCFIAAIYALFTETFTVRSVVWILGVCLGAGLIGGGIIELFNYQTIFVDDSGISTVGPNRKVFVPWANIDKVFYTWGEGVPANQPFVSFYIKSKNDEIIKISQYIRDFHELGSIVLERCSSQKAEYISFFDLARLYYKSYFKKPNA